MAGVEQPSLSVAPVALRTCQILGEALWHSGADGPNMAEASISPEKPGSPGSISPVWSSKWARKNLG